MASLRVTVCKLLVLATTPQPEEQEYYYNSDDSVINLEYPDISEQVVEWKVARQAAALSCHGGPATLGK